MGTGEEAQTTMSWGHKEKVAVLRTLVQLSLCDNDFAVAEQNNIVSFINDYHLDGSAINEARSMSDQEVVRIIRNFTDAEKFVVKTYWMKQIQADNRIADSEAQLLIDLSIACNVDISELYH